MVNNYDIAIIGGGPAGYSLAIILATHKKNICLINGDKIGGTCLHEGCIGTKNFLQSADFIQKIDYFNSCGVDVTFNELDLKQLRLKTEALIKEQQNAIEKKLKNLNVYIENSYVSGIKNNSILLKDKDYTIQAKHIVIATGSKHKEHPTIKIDKKNIISSKEVFQLDKIPKSILIIGGGAIGCEFATFFNSIKSKVDIAEFMPNILNGEDKDVSATLIREFKKRKIDVYLNCKVKICDTQQLKATLTTPNKTINNVYDKILISIGRSPNTEFLQNSDIALKDGFVVVDDNFSTIHNKNIYAIGDVVNTQALAHIAYYEAKIVANMILNKNKIKKTDIFPSVVFSLPEVASVGKKEFELENNNIDFAIQKYFFKSSAKAKIKGNDSGFIKIIYDKKSYMILGASIVAEGAVELIHQILIAINAKLSIKQLSNMIFAHPTLSESFLEVFNNAK